MSRKVLYITIILMLILATLVVFSFLDKRKQTIDNRGPVLTEQNIGGQSIDYSDEEVNKAALQPVRLIDETDHYIGDLVAPIQIIIYFDFDCPFSAVFFSTVKQVEAEFGEQAVIAFRHFPQASHYNAMSAALAVECADEQGEFFAMYDKLFNEAINNVLSEEVYLKTAHEIGLNQEEFSLCLKDKKYYDKIMSQMLEAYSSGVVGTPTIFVNNIILPGAYPMDDFVDSAGMAREGLRNIINKELNK